MKPEYPLNWKTGLKAAYEELGARIRDQYSWVASLGDGYVFSAEVDHKNPENTQYSHPNGEFFKRVPPMSRDTGHEPLSISHSRELFEAALHAHEEQLDCRLLLLKGTKFGTNKGPIRAAADGHTWKVVEISGSVEQGYSFRAERVP